MPELVETPLGQNSESLNRTSDQVTDQATDQVTDQVRQLLAVMDDARSDELADRYQIFAIFNPNPGSSGSQLTISGFAKISGSQLGR
jgi:hypothetical protein